VELSSTSHDLSADFYHHGVQCPTRSAALVPTEFPAQSASRPAAGPQVRVRTCAVGQGLVVDSYPAELGAGPLHTLRFSGGQRARDQLDDPCRHRYRPFLPLASGHCSPPAGPPRRPAHAVQSGSLSPQPSSRPYSPTPRPDQIGFLCRLQPAPARPPVKELAQVNPRGVPTNGKRNGVLTQRSQVFRFLRQPAQNRHSNLCVTGGDL
jgi:hypothetical protein